MTRTITSVVLAGICLITLAGCETGQSTTSLDHALKHYNSCRYSLAQEQAQNVRNTATGALRASAAYLAGLSAYQLGHIEQARSDLSIAASSTDQQTAGLASAQLGIIELDRNNPILAARHFETASSKLEGSVARQASQHAAMAYQAAGDFQQAERWARHSEALATETNKAGSAIPMSNRFVLQAGAFQSRIRAERTARELEPLASDLRLGPVRIVQGPTSRGADLHMVQFGAFRNRSEANRARANLGRLEVIVVPSMQ